MSTYSRHGHTFGQKSEELLRYKEHIKKLKSLEVDTLTFFLDTTRKYKTLFVLSLGSIYSPYEDLTYIVS